MILLGGPVFGGSDDPNLWPGDPNEWAERVCALGYRAAYSPVDDPDDDRVDAFSHAADRAQVVIAEVGIWRNLITTDERARRANIARAQELLDLADRLGARCALTFAGTRGESSWGWGPCDENFSEATFTLIVDTAREIIDAVQPRRAKFSLETMQTVFPDSPENYARLVDAIDRDAFAVSFDPVNLIVSPRVYAEHRQMIRTFIDMMGDRIVSCHVKDVRLTPDLLVHLEEFAPGEGAFDYQVLLSELARLPRSIPVMLEHLRSESAYARAAAFVRGQIELADHQPVSKTQP